MIESTPSPNAQARPPHRDAARWGQHAALVLGLAAIWVVSGLDAGARPGLAALLVVCLFAGAWLVEAAARGRRRVARRDAALLAERAALAREVARRGDLDAAPVAILVLDGDDVVVRANAAASRLFSEPPGGVVGRAFATLVRDGEGDGASAPSWGVRADGREVPLRVVSDVGDGAMGRARIVALRDASAELAQVAALEVARDEALAAARAKSEQLATVSHEVRTPISGVLGVAALLLEGDLSSEQRELAHHIHSSASALIALLDDVLQVARLRAGAVALDEVPFDPLEVVEEVAVLHYDGAERKGLRLVVATTHDLHRQLVGDPNRVRQVVNNLVGNAVKFTHTGHVRVAISTEATTAGAVELKVEVEDSGVGVPADKLERIFERFARVESGPHMAEGTGLGLTIARHVARLMGGDVTVKSRASAGSVFTFTSTHAAGQSSRDATLAPDTVAGARILVALSTRLEREAVVGFLASYGASCVGATSAGQAMTMAATARHQRRPYSVIVADHAMADVDWKALAAVAGDERPARVILCCRLMDRLDDDLLARVAPQDVLRKPLRLSRLVGAVAAAIHGAEEATAPTRVRAPAPPPPKLSRADSRPVLKVVAPLPSPEPPAAMPELDAGLLGARVLVAEDNPTNQKVASVMLSRLGCEVTLASDGREALDKLREGEFDIVFMDCQMPEFDGYEAARQVRSWGGRFASLPIVALTAHTMQGDRDRSIAAGMDDHLTKPFTREGLRDSLERWLPARERANRGA